MENITGKKLFVFLLLLAVYFIQPPNSYALNKSTTASTDEHHQEKEKFKPGDFIMGHIADEYDWHIFEIGDFHLVIPLPIIVYSKHTGIHVFLSNKFHHGHSHKGLKIAKKGENEGKIIEKLPNGEIYVPWDLSITKNVVAIFVSIALLIWIFVSVANKYKKNPNKAPTGFQNAVEPLITFIRDDVAIPAIGKNKYEPYLPFLLTLFFFILINNLMGLVPIFPFGANVTGNITVTMVLALFTFVITSISGNKHYWSHIVNTPGVPWWFKIPIPLMPIIEIMGVFTKPFVLMVRLFANISAGHIIALGFFSLIFIFGEMNVYAGYGISVVSIIFTIFMSFLEMLVAFIQAYVFTLLSALYFGMALQDVEH